jgi:acyl carrier protein
MRDRLRSIIAAELEVPLDTVPTDAGAETFQPWDSLGQMRIVVAIEEQLGVRFATAEIAELTSIDKLLGALAARDKT